MNLDKQVVLDTETTGMNKNGAPYLGHRIIEIGAIEIINRKLTGKKFHVYLNPDRKVDIEAFNVHGISNEFLLDKPYFNEVLEEFLLFIKNSTLIIHNASFDIGFLNNELRIAKKSNMLIENCYKIIDTLSIARKFFPGKSNSLDALCERYSVHKNKRFTHGALLDAEILADIFLLMTSCQTKFILNRDYNYRNDFRNQFNYLKNKRKSNKSLKVIYADEKDDTLK